MTTEKDIAVLRREISDVNAELRRIAAEFKMDFPGLPPEYKDRPEYLALLAQKQGLRERLRRARALAGDLDAALTAEGSRPSPTDVWMPIWETGLTHYEASDSGFIRSRATHRVYTRRAQGRLLWVSLVDADGIVRCRRVDKLVASAWLSTPTDAVIAFFDGNPFNCRKENLEWVR